VDGTNISSDWPAKKLAFEKASLFPVIKKIGSSAYKLKIPKMWKNLHPVINESKLRPYHRQRPLPNCYRTKSGEHHTRSWRVYIGSEVIKGALQQHYNNVKTSTTAIPTHTGFPQFEFPESLTAKFTAKLQRRDLKGGNVTVCLMTQMQVVVSLVTITYSLVSVWSLIKPVLPNTGPRGFVTLGESSFYKLSLVRS